MDTPSLLHVPLDKEVVTPTIKFIHGHSVTIDTLPQLATVGALRRALLKEDAHGHFPNLHCLSGVPYVTARICRKGSQGFSERSISVQQKYCLDEVNALFL